MTQNGRNEAVPNGRSTINSEVDAREALKFRRLPEMASGTGTGLTAPLAHDLFSKASPGTKALNRFRVKGNAM